MTEDDELPDGALILSEIRITHFIPPEGDTTVIRHRARTNEGEVIPLVESLGLLRLTEDSLIREAMGEVPDD